MQLDSSESLVAGIYEAAAFPERWPEVLDGIAARVGAMGTVLATYNIDAWMGFTVSEKISLGLDEFLVSPNAQQNEATKRVTALDRQGFVASHEVMTDAEWSADPMYNEWVGRTGGFYCAGTSIVVPSGELAVYHTHRKAGQPPFEQRDLDVLDSYRPHLARAALLATRWRLERMRVAAEALALIGLPALNLDRAGQVLAANALIQDMVPPIRWLPKDRIALVDPAANAMLRLSLLGLGTPLSTSVRSFAARAGLDRQAVVFHLIPTPGQARDLFDGALGVLVATEVTAPEAPDLSLIRGLFDLTPSEARVARGIVRGLTNPEIAAAQGVGQETIRSQVKSLLAKTGTRDRTAAASLLAALPKIPLTEG